METEPTISTVPTPGIRQEEPNGDSLPLNRWQSAISDLLCGQSPGEQTSKYRTTIAVAVAEQLDRLCPPTQSASDVEAYLWTLWEVFVVTAAKQPHDVDLYKRVDLVSVLASLRQRAKGTVRIWGREHRLWTDLPLFGAFIREAWIDPAYNGRDPSPEAVAAWRNLNCFAARCLGSGVAYWHNLALWQLRAALEEEHTSSAASECNIWSASEWVIHSSAVLFRVIRSDVENSGNGAPMTISVGSLYKGEPVLSRERWDFWKTRFSELGKGGEHLRVEVRTLANAAVEAMESVES